MRSKLIVILTFIIILIFFNKNIVQYFIIKKLSYWTENEVELKLQKINFFSGIILIDQFKIKNKKNFFYKNIFESKNIQIELNLKTILSNLVEINKLIINDPKLYIEIKNIKKSKKNKIKDNLELIEKLSDNNKPKEYPPKNKDKNFIILKMSIQNSQAFIKHKKDKENIEIKLSDMQFSMVGNAGKNGTKNFLHFKDVIRIILNDIFFRIPDENLRTIIKENYKIK